MSLYNLIHGMDDHAEEYLAWLHLSMADFERFRDAYLNVDGTEITVLARIGRNSWCENPEEILKYVSASPYFLREHDDEFDCTFKYIIYKVPRAFRGEAKRLAPTTAPLTLREKTDLAAAEMQGMTHEQLLADPRFSKLAKGMEQAIKNGGGGIEL